MSYEAGPASLVGYLLAGAAQQAGVATASTRAAVSGAKPIDVLKKAPTAFEEPTWFRV